MPVATLDSSSNCERGERDADQEMIAKMSRRTSRRRVVVAGESSPARHELAHALAALGERAVHELARSRTRPRSRRRRRSSRCGGPLRTLPCRNGLPAWRLRLPPRGARAIAAVRGRRRSGRRADRPVLPRGGAPRGGLRRALLRSCDRRPGARERRQVRRAGAHARARPTRCSRRSPAGTPSGTCASPTPATATASPAPPSSRSTRCWCGPSARSFGGSHGALLVAAYLVSLARLPRGARPAPPADGARARAAARAPDAAAAGGLPRRALLRRALLGEPLPARWRWARSTPRARAAGPGPGPARGLRLGHAQRRACCCCCRSR